MNINLQIPSDHPSYPDHFPGMTIVPGVVLLELILNACNRLGFSTTSLNSCKFLKLVQPGQQLQLQVETPVSSKLTVRLEDGNTTYLTANFNLGEPP